MATSKSKSKKSAKSAPVAAKANGQVELQIVIPVYNEKDNFEKTYREVQDKIKLPKALYVVYDFDEDNTVPVVQKLAKNDPKLHLVKNTIGRGALNAIKSGFQAAKPGPCLVIMADLSDDLTSVAAMYQAYLDGAQVIAGSRYMRGGKQIGGPLLKRVLSRLAGTSLHYVRGVPTHDVTNNFKLYDKKLLDKINIESKGGFEIATEITVKAFIMGATIREVPTTWRDRTAGESNFKLWKWLPSYLKWYFYAFRPKTKA